MIWPGFDRDGWAGDIAALERLGFEFEAHIRAGARVFFRRQRDRRDRHRTWWPIRVLHHPEILKCIARKAGKPIPTNLRTAVAGGDSSAAADATAGPAPTNGRHPEDDPASDPPFVLRDEATLAMWGPLGCVRAPSQP